MHPIEDVIAIRFGWSEKHLTIQKKPLSDTQTDVNVKQIRSNRKEWTAEWMSAKMVCLHQSKTKSTLECGRRRRKKKMRRRLFLLFSSKIINITVNSRAAVKLNITTTLDSFGPLYWHHRLFGTLYPLSSRNCMKKELSMELSRLKTLISFHPNALWNSVSSQPPQSHLQYGECFVIVIRPCRLLSQVM